MGNLGKRLSALEAVNMPGGLSRTGPMVWGQIEAGETAAEASARVSAANPGRRVLLWQAETEAEFSE